MHDTAPASNPSQSECPFCRGNQLLQGEVLAETENAYLVESKFGTSNYLIIPEAHIESPLGLPANWWQAVAQLLLQVPGMPTDYNISLNYGRQAGQTMPHLHFWIVPRQDGQPASGKGLARLLSEANQTV